MKKCFNKHVLFFLSLIVLSLSFALISNPQTAVGDSAVGISAMVDDFSELRLSSTKASKRIQAVSNSENGISLIIDGEISTSNSLRKIIDLGQEQAHLQQRQVLLVPQY